MTVSRGSSHVPSSPETTALILAGGRGERLGAELPKQLLELEPGSSVLDLVLESYDSFDAVHSIVVVASPAHRERIADTSRRYAKVREIVDGGATRQASVMRGLERVDTRFVVIHEAARPLVEESTVNACLEELRAGHRAVMAVCPTVDTIVALDRDEHIAEFHPRGERYWVQSPGAFETDLLRRCYERARADGSEDIPGETGVLHAYADVKIKAVDGGVHGLKLTYPRDLDRLQAQLRDRGDRAC